MSNTSSLTELANFVGQSKLASDNAAIRRRAVDGLAVHYHPRPKLRGVADLLGIVMVLSARTRRAAMAPVAIDLDVFAPSGHRALRLMLPRPDQN